VSKFDQDHGGTVNATSCFKVYCLKYKDNSRILKIIVWHKELQQQNSENHCVTQRT